jgi:hypothetical protein
MLPRYPLHGINEAFPSVRVQLDIIGVRRGLLILHAYHYSTARRPFQPPRRSAILGSSELT